MKKLIAMIGAVAMAFGLYAEDPAPVVNKFSTSFEAADVGVNDTDKTWDAGEAGWTTTQTDAFTLGAQDQTGLPYAEGRARRDDLFEGKAKNDNFLKLETGTNTLSHGIGTAQVYFDQLVKFTGYEEDPVIANDAKIAVWLKAVDEDDPATEEVNEIETNLYVTVGTGTEAKNVQIAGDFKVDQWYRVTIKSIDNVSTVERNSQLGFQLFIDGAAASIVEGDDRAYNDNSDSFNTTAAALYAKGELFTAIKMNDLSLATVAYQGIGGVDDIIFSEEAPDFDQFVEIASISAAPNGEVVKVVDKNGTEYDFTEAMKVPAGDITVTVKPAAGIIFYDADDNRVATLDKTVAATAGDMTIELDEGDFGPAAVEILPTEGEARYYDAAEAEAYLAADNLPVDDGDTVTFLQEISVWNGDDQVFVFTPETTIEVSASEGVSYWTVNVQGYGEDEDYTAGSLIYNAPVAPKKDITVRLGDSEDGLFEFGGSLIAGALAVEGLVNLTADVITLTGAGSLSTTTVLTEAKFTTEDAGKVVYIDSTTEPGVYTAMLVEEAADVCEINGVGYKTLADALPHAVGGQTIKFLADITENADISGATTTLDLNGKTLTGYIYSHKGADVTVSNGTVTCAGSYTVCADYVAAITIGDGAKIINTALKGKALDAYDGCTAIVEEGAELESAYTGIFVWNDGAEGNTTTLTVNGKVTGTSNIGIAGYGDDKQGTNITIGEKAVIASDDVGVFFPNAGTLTVNGGTITAGNVGIYAKSGTVNITGGQITATAETVVDPQALGDGTGTTAGYAVVLETGSEQSGYANNLNFTISGGKFTSNGPAVYNFVRTGADPIAAGISGGLFKAKPADALLVEPTTEGYKAVWVADETVTGYWKPGTEAIEYAITYKYTNDQGEAETISDLNPNQYNVEDAGSLPLPTKMPAGFTGGELEAWYTTAELTGEPVSVIPAGSIGEKTFWAKLKSVVDPVEEEIKANVDTEGLDDAAKAKVYANTVKLNTACGGSDEAMAWMTAVYGNQKVPGAKLAATDADLIAMSVEYNLPIVTQAPTAAVEAAESTSGAPAFQFTITADSDVSIDLQKAAVQKIVKYRADLATGAFGDSTGKVSITVDEVERNVMKAEFVAGPAKGFMKADFTVAK